MRYALCATLAACAARNATPAVPSQSWVGLRYHDAMTELPAPLEWLGESLVGPTEGEHAITWARAPGVRGTVVLPERMVEADPPLFEVVAVAALPPIPKGTSLHTLDCTLGGQPDPWVLAIGEEHAYRFVPEGPRLDPVPAEEVTCPTLEDDPMGVPGGQEGAR